VATRMFDASREKVDTSFCVVPMSVGTTLWTGYAVVQTTHWVSLEPSHAILAVCDTIDLAVELLCLCQSQEHRARLYNQGGRPALDLPRYDRILEEHLITTDVPNTRARAFRLYLPEGKTP
jgi:hypothetical protein